LHPRRRRLPERAAGAAGHVGHPRVGARRHLPVAGDLRVSPCADQPDRAAAAPPDDRHPVVHERRGVPARRPRRCHRADAAGGRSLKVRAKGGGGRGGSRTTTGDGGGGGGGATAGIDAYTVTPGQTVAVTVGAGGAGGGYPALTASYFVHQDTHGNSTLVSP